MNTALKMEGSPSLFNKDKVSFTGGWCWGDQLYWGQAGVVVGIVPPSVVMDAPHDQKSTEYWFYFAAVARAISCAATMNGELNEIPDFNTIGHKLAVKRMKDSIKNGTPVIMLLAEYELNEVYRQPNLSDLHVVEYKKGPHAVQTIRDSHDEIMTYIRAQLAEDVLCEQCGERKCEMTARFSEEEFGFEEQRLCWSCFEELTKIEEAWSFTDWYKHTQEEQWAFNSKLTDSMKQGYEEYCDSQNIVPFWDYFKEDEPLQLGDYVEVMSPFTIRDDEHHEIGERFVIKTKHMAYSLEKWVKKIDSTEG